MGGLFLRRRKDKKRQQGENDQGWTFLPHQLSNFFSICSARSEASRARPP